jgi:hypothetical protein
MFVKLLVMAALFVALTPGVLVSLPPGGSQLVVAATHAVVFVLAWSLLWKSGLLSKRR